MNLAHLTRTFWLGAFWATTITLGALAQPAAGPLRVSSITPSGEDVPPARQIVIQFDRPVVPVGRMERTAAEIPIRIEPQTACEWRWLNTSALACQLGEEKALSPATRYTLRIGPGLKAQDGSTLAEETVHTFTTERPKVAHAYFETWKGPAFPVIQVTLNQVVSGASLKSHLVFEGPGGARIPLTATERPRAPGEKALTWTVSPERPLPEDAAIQLKQEPGLASLEGPEPSVDARVVLQFYTYPKHRFLGVKCTDIQGNELRIPAGPPAGGGACNPMGPVALVFSSPVIKEVLRDHLGVEPDLAGGRKDYDPWENSYSYSRLRDVRDAGEEYPSHFPELLKARTPYRLRAKAADLKDEFGRPLAADIDFSFRTDDRPPRLVLTHPVSVLERQVETHVPVVVTNLDKIDVQFQAVSREGVERREVELPVSSARNVAYSFPFKVREWLRGRSGAVYGTVSSRPATPNDEERVFFSTVTPFHVHAKVGHRNALVWVTDLATGLPVEGARVRLYKDDVTKMTAEPSALSIATTNSEGVALLAGTSQIDPNLDLLKDRTLFYGDQSEFLWVRVDKGGEIAVAPLSYDFQLYPQAVNEWIPSDLRRRYGRIRTWGTTAQGVYRVGDTVQYKLYVRDQDNRQFSAAPRKSYTLQVIDPMDKTVLELRDLELNDFGSYSGELKIPESGAVGWYSFKLSADFLENHTWAPLTVLVADFTPAPFRVTTDLSGDRFRAGDEVAVTTSAKLHAGGPYADAETRLTVTLQPTPFRPENPKASGFYFETASTDTETLHQSDGAVNKEGVRDTKLTLSSQDIIHGRLRFESAVRDDRGKYVSGFAGAGYTGRDRFAGVQQKDWVLQSGTSADVFSVVVDEGGNLVNGVSVTTKIEHEETLASRVKGAGNAYLTQYVHEWKEVKTCQDTSSAEPLTCTFTPEKAGAYRMTVSINDTQGRPHQSTEQRWSMGKGRVLWETLPGHQLQIEPEKSDYRVGDTARFLIKNPFPGARALFTVERVGVQRSWTQVLEDSSALVELEVTPDHLPGFYFSAVVTSPRVEPPPGAGGEGEEGDVDLGKPAFRMGYVRVPVRDPYKEIEIEVTPERNTYKPREKVKVSLAAHPRHPAGPKLPEMEMAVAVLDEAVFDLISKGKDYFDPYQGFYELEDLDLQNFNLLTRLVGIQKFEKKGANPGGGGGMGPDVRSLFKFVCYWNPSLRTDAEGRASIELEVPDNLTGWRVLALAVTRTDLMGLGQGTFAVNRPTEIRPALPNQVTVGDSFTARFTIMNRTESKRTLTVSAKVEGPASSPGLTGQTIEAAPYQRYTVAFPVRTLREGDLTFAVRAGDATDADALRLPLDVRRLTALEAAATYGTTTDAEVKEAIAFPKDIRTDAGRVGVVATPSVIGGVETAFDYMRDYPYICWEQKLTKGVMASHFKKLRSYLRKDVKWPGHEKLPDETLAEAANYQAPGGAMCYYRADDAYGSPYLSAYTALAFNWLRDRGHQVPPSVETKLHDYLLELLRKEVFPEFYSKGMASGVRAVALAALARNGKVTRSDLDRYRRSVPEMDVFGKAHYLMAAAELKADAALLKEVRDQILAKSNQTGGKFVFTETVDDGYQRILHSSARSSCAVLSALTREQGGAPAGTGIGDIPFKLTRAITQERERRDRWENTQENMFCMNALIDYAQVYESEKPDMTVRAFLDDKALGTARFDDVRDGALELARPIGPKDPGREATLKIEKQGPGRLYYAARLLYSPLQLKTEPINSGIEVKREYSVERGGEWVLLKDPMTLRPGELARVDLYLSLPAPRNFVVVDDPVPGGLEPVNRDLATASQVDAEKAEVRRSRDSFWFTRDDWFAFESSHWSFYHRELRHHAARFYSEYLPAGNYHLSYVAQAIAPGEFQILPTHAEEMYDPDVFGKGVPQKLRVEEPSARAERVAKRSRAASVGAALSPSATGVGPRRGKEMLRHELIEEPK